MTTATETAMTALAAVLTGAAGLPNVRRDVILDTLMEDFASEGKALSRALVLRIGDPVETERYIGVGDARFELVRNADAELFVSGPEGSTLIAAFDAALEALFVALEANPTLERRGDARGNHRAAGNRHGGGRRACRAASLRQDRTHLSLTQGLLTCRRMTPLNPLRPPRRSRAAISS